MITPNDMSETYRIPVPEGEVPWGDLLDKKYKHPKNDRPGIHPEILNDWSQYPEDSRPGQTGGNRGETGEVIVDFKLAQFHRELKEV